MQAVAFVSQLVTLGLQVWIMALMSRKLLIKRFPLFFGYVVYAACETVFRWTIFALSGNGSLRYFYCYWITELIDWLFLLAVLGESGWHIFRPFRRLRWLWWGLAGSICLALGYGCLGGWKNPPVGVSSLLSLITRVDLTAAYVPVTVGVFIFVVIWRLNIWQRPREAGIILGLAMIGAVEVITVGARSILGTRSVFGISVYEATAWAAALGYIFAELVWLREFSRPEPPTEDAAMVLDAAQKIDAVLDQYLQGLKKIRG